MIHLAPGGIMYLLLITMNSWKNNKHFGCSKECYYLTENYDAVGLGGRTVNKERPVTCALIGRWGAEGLGCSYSRHRVDALPGTAGSGAWALPWFPPSGEEVEAWMLSWKLVPFWGLTALNDKLQQKGRSEKGTHEPAQEEEATEW